MPNLDARTIAAQSQDHDGFNPLNDSALLVLDGVRPGQVIVDSDGFAVLDDHDGTVLIAVAPQARGAGLGTHLAAAALRARPQHTFWAFRTQPAARAVAKKLGLVAVRELLRMGRPLADETPSPVPEGYEIRPYHPDDAPGVVAVNAAAFVHHPEQGRLSLDDFLALTAQTWFDAAGLLVAVRDAEIVGFHWTKRHDATTGEVYVIAVLPEHSGAGLGRALLSAGLAHLEEQGCAEVTLFVEADQTRVVGMYTAAGFQVLSVDTSYAAEATS